MTSVDNEYIIKDKLPSHIAIIMDGNGRWANMRGLSRSDGHRAGAAAAREIVSECRALGIRFLTLYAFSSENWKRPKTEIAALFGLLLEFLKVETPLMEKQGIAMRVLGDIDGLPGAQRAALRHAIAKTGNGGKMRLNLALNYGSRAEIVRAARNMLLAGVNPDDISEESFKKYLYTGDDPDPDLLIRTSGEQRLSNYLLYQCAYSEIYFTDTLWPDFGPEELRKALISYAGRERRFGGSEQSTSSNGAESDGG